MHTEYHKGKGFSISKPYKYSQNCVNNHSAKKLMYQGTQPRKLCGGQVCYLQKPLTYRFQPFISL